MSNIDVLSQTQVINVTLPGQTIVVNPVTSVPLVVDQAAPSISIVNAGPQGPPGQGAGFNFTQSSALTSWTINHNLGYKPSVQVFTVGGLEMLAEVQHTSINQTVVTFNSAVSGTARLI